MEENRTRIKKIQIIGILALIVAVIAGISLGGADMDILESLKALLNQGSLSQNTIIWFIRVPRVLLAILVGGGLSIVGGVYQGIFRNPMADPFVLGISSGAALGATISIVVGVYIPLLGFSGSSIFAFLGAIVTIVAIYAIAGARGNKDSSTLLLSGIALNFFASSIIYLFMFIRYDKLKQIIMWTFGSFSGANWEKVIVATPVILIGSVILMVFARDLNGILIGEKQAHSFGIAVEKVRNILVAISTVMIAVMVSASGIIGFVGLMVPHLLRLVVGSDYRKLMPASFIYGATFMVLSDMFARTVVKPGELPIGAITALFGAPFFIFLLIRNKRMG